MALGGRDKMIIAATGLVLFVVAQPTRTDADVISVCEEIDILHNPLAYGFHKARKGKWMCVLVPDCCTPAWPANPLCYVEKLSNPASIPRQLSTTITCSNYNYTPAEMVQKYLEYHLNPMSHLSHLSPIAPIADAFRQYYTEALGRAQRIPDEYKRALEEIAWQYPFTQSDIDLARVIPASDPGARWLLPDGFDGVTFYDLIVVKDDVLDPSSGFCADLAALGHELVHVHQYREQGLERFWTNYLPNRWILGYCNEQNEQEAYAVDPQIFRACDPVGQYKPACPSLGPVWLAPRPGLVHWVQTSPQEIGWGPGVFSSAWFVADISGDHRADLVFTFQDGARGLAVRSLVSAGNGTWSSKHHGIGWGSGVQKSPTRTGDIDGDGRRDLVFPFIDSRKGLTVRTLRSRGDGTWDQAEQNLRDGPGVLEWPIFVGDVNRDGKADLVYTAQDAKRGMITRTRFSNGDGSFSDAHEAVVGWGGGVRQFPTLMGDLNADGGVDLVFLFVPKETGLTVRTLRSRGDGSWDAAEQNLKDGPGVMAHPTLIGDVDGDGDADLVFAFQDAKAGLTLRTRLSRGDGTFDTHAAVVGWGGGVQRAPTHLADIDADGRQDLVFPFVQGSEIVLRSLVSNGDGTWKQFHENTGWPGGALASVTRDDTLLFHVSVANVGGQPGADVLIPYPTSRGLVVGTLMSKR